MRKPPANPTRMTYQVRQNDKEANRTKKKTNDRRGSFQMKDKEVTRVEPSVWKTLPSSVKSLIINHNNSVNGSKGGQKQDKKQKVNNTIRRNNNVQTDNQSQENKEDQGSEKNTEDVPSIRSFMASG